MKGYFEQHDKVMKDPTLIILLVELAKQRGIHADKLLKGTKLFQHDLQNSELAFSHQQFTRLINNSIKLMNSPDVPFLLGSRLFPTQLGHIGLALSNARHLQDMLRIIKCYQSQIFPFMFVSEQHHLTTRYLTFNHAITSEGEAYHIFMCELLIALVFSAIKWRMKKVPQLHVRLPFKQPEHIEQYQAYLGDSYQFLHYGKQTLLGSTSSHYLGLQIAVNDALFTLPFAESSQVIKRHHLKQVLENRVSVGLIQFVLQIIAHEFEQGSEISLAKIAEKLNVSSATVKRKLTAHNTSYQQLLDCYRQQQAIFQLIEQGHSNEKVAIALKFSDITNFRRSFKRWTGITPNALKQTFEDV